MLFGFSFSAESYVAFFSFFPFFFFFLAFTRFREETKFTVYETNVIVHALFRYFLYIVHETYSHLIKNGSHGTFHTFKNYFVTVFSIFNKNKLNQNGPLA